MCRKPSRPADLDWERHVAIDARYFRPTEVDYLQADAGKAARALGWKPRVTFAELVRIMVDADMEALGLTPMGDGLRILTDEFEGWHRWGERGVSRAARRRPRR